MIGPFFCIENKIYAYRVPLHKAEPYGACLTTSVSHLDFWDSELTTHFSEHEYESFPRGRVVYKDGIFFVYLDHCLDYLPAIEAILTTFEISAEPWHIDYDEHYQCAACMARENGEVVFDSALRTEFNKDGALDMLHPSQYGTFENALQRIFAQIYKRPDTQIRIDENNCIQITCGGAPLRFGLSMAEEQATELAYKAALAQILGKKLVLFRPTARMDRPTAANARRFVEGLPKDQVIISSPFGGYWPREKRDSIAFRRQEHCE
ncbi:hypothetical protein LJC61_08285 [Ruminococcaceae bacterium OttesenSCG-928-A16]|nr:hypothetical protein [Ruminococcaceae bacterium OttesenSCG-928-A16]